MSTFRDAIAQALYERPQPDAIGDPFALDAAAVLAMPEMEAIRQVLLGRFVAKNPVGRFDGYSVATGRQHMAAAGLPESVIEWVLG